jgi:hypothetical protein
VKKQKRVYFDLRQNSTKFFSTDVETDETDETDSIPNPEQSLISIDSADNALYNLFTSISKGPLAFGYASSDLLSNIPIEEEGGEHEQPDPSDVVDYTPLEALKQCHNSRIGHHGARRTWNSLNKFFPGHRIPYRIVMEYVAECPICQKDRLVNMNDALVPLVRHLKRPGPRSRIGIDTLTITPTRQTWKQILDSHR